MLDADALASLSVRSLIAIYRAADAIAAACVSACELRSDGVVALEG